MLQLNLSPPVSRRGTIRRDRILKMLAADDSQLVTVVAPAGYGKTTLLSQWMDESSGPSAWLSLDLRDNDPAVLMESLVNSLATGGLIQGESGLTSLSSEMVLTRGVPLLTDLIREANRPGRLFLDQLDSLETITSLDVIGAFLARLPAHLRVVLASRSTEGLPIALLRSQGGVLELSMADLAMDHSETATFVERAGFELGAENVDVIVNRTEGWPAGIYLSTLVMRAGNPDPLGDNLRGDDFFFADYLRDEILANSSEEQFQFLARSSMLHQLSGPLCDFVLQTEDSARVLERLERSNLLVVPLDRTRHWYRYHSLLRDFLRAELERSYPDESTKLHGRAAEWFEAHGYAELAVEHAIAAGDHRRVVEIVKDIARPTYALGRADTASVWFDWLEANQAIRDHADLAAVICYIQSLNGDFVAAERSAAYALRDVDGRPIPDEQLDPVAFLCRSLQCPRGPELALADARAAREPLSSSLVWKHLPLAMEGMALDSLGDRDAADVCWKEALELSEGLDANPFRSIAFSALAWSAIRRDDWETASAFVGQALAVIEENRLEPYVTSGLSFALAARVAARNGMIDEATTFLGKAAATRPRLTRVVPLAAAQALLEMTRASLELSDIGGARRVLREVGDLIAIRPKLGEFVVEFTRLKDKLADLPAGSVGASALTKAELRLLPLLVTHLSYPEIADRLFVSRHTVKTQAISIYRKLNVSSRTDAVETARALGLISL